MDSARIVRPDDLVTVVNTGDDFQHLGLHISPDLDTVMYTLAEVADPDRGWGIAGETWAFMEAISRFEEETWFNLGDKDLATHLYRTRALKQGLGAGRGHPRTQPEFRHRTPDYPHD